MHPGWILLIAMGIVLGGILLLRLHAFLALLLAALAVALLTPTGALEDYAQAQLDREKWSEREVHAFLRASPPQRVADAFGTTCGKIGILIAMASIIGKCMLDSGAADRIVRRTLELFGEARAGVAFAGSSFVLAIPVFFDTVFYLMIPLAKAMRLRTGKNYLLYVLTILAGGSIAHSLVPPTPGPLYVADQMGINLGLMIAAGCAVGLVAALAGYLYAVWANRRWVLELDDSADQSLGELAKLSARDERELPPTWLALAPIVLPVALIAGSTVVSMAVKHAETRGTSTWLVAIEPTVDLLGDKNVALILGAAVALIMLARHTRGSAEELTRKVQTALAGGGVIILITSAGGAFGAAMGQCGVAGEVARLSGYVHPALILPLAFGVTAVFRGVQGSATVAMMTTVGLFGQLATGGTLDFHPVYLALAIGCGSKPLSWMNDSGFWVICKMSGMTEAEGLRTITPQLTLMGLAGLAATMLGAIWFPLT